MKEEEIKREKRRRRRIRNQILAYFTLAVFALVAVAGLYLGVHGIVRYVKKYNDKVSEVIAEAESQAEHEGGSIGTGDEAVDNEKSSLDYEEKQYYSYLEDDPLGELVDTLLQKMTIEEMAAGMFMVTPESLTGVQTVVQAGDGTKNAITQMPVGGLIYAPKNFKSEEQFKEMLSNTVKFSKYPLFLGVTAECGYASHFGVEDTEKASELTDTDSVKTVYTKIAEKIASYGVNMNMAPVSEIVSADGDKSLQGRTFGSDAATAAPLVNASVQALQELEISAVLQKFPGAGTTTKTLEELKNSEFLIYEAAIKGGVDCIMVSNVVSKGITGEDIPDSLSSVVITDVLRNELGFEGVVITDALDAEEITQKYTPAEASVAAIKAGADILYRPAELDEAYNGVIKAIEDGILTKERIYESLYRIYRVKYKNAMLE